jgi:hypothetical protein
MVSEIKLAVCTYDNPVSMVRECWQDGVLLCHYSQKVLAPLAKEPIPPEHFFFGANIGPWKKGQLVGDVAALGDFNIDTGEFK